MKAGNFLIVGNDKKMTECKKRLSSLGYNASSNGSDDFLRSVPFYDNIILPLPTVANGCIAGTGKTVQDLLNVLTDKQHVFCGNISADVFGESGYSYYYDESFLIKNSRLTAQGALKIIIENIEKDFFNMKAAVLGYGRCGKAVCRLLKNNGFTVTSFSRKNESRILAENDGCKTAEISQIDKMISLFDIIVNTVPFNIISEKGLEKLTQDHLYIEIASKPYGFDISKADIFNFRYVLGESLPGKFVPVSAGMNIADTVLDILKEGNYG